MKEIISQVNLQTQIGKLALAIKRFEEKPQYCTVCGTEECRKGGKPIKAPVVFVGILNGAFMFFSDLVKKVDIPMEIDFVRVKSYDGQERKEIQLTKDLEVDINGKHVYLVDDIIDSGHTMKYLIDLFKERGATDVTPVAAIHKDNLVIPDSLCILEYPQDSPWFVGYGMDNEDGTCRNIETILELDNK